MHHDERRGGAEFDREVAVGDGVERILADGLEPEKRRGHFAVDRVGRAGQGRGAQGAAVHAGAQIEQAFAVALEHFDVGEHVVPERDGLRHLHVGEARHDDVGVLLRLGDQDLLEVFDAADDFVRFGTQIEADVGRHLVVAGAPRVESLPGVADQRGEARLDVEVDVFEFELPLKGARGDFFADLGHPAADVFEILRADDADLFEHRRVREGTFDVGQRHALVEVHARRVAEHEGVHGFGESAGPRLLLGVQRVVGMVFLVVHWRSRWKDDWRAARGGEP